jgi:hypothetical protein
MKLALYDRYGDVTEYKIEDYVTPVLLTLDGFPAMDMSANPYFPQKYEGPKKSDPPVKAVLDSFLMRPNPPLMADWVSMDPESPAFKLHFEVLAEALFVLTGKLLVGVVPTKVNRPWPRFSTSP